MSKLRTGRRKYYDLFSNFYDAFIRLHARRNEDDTRYFLVDASLERNKPIHSVLDVCCGTGSVILAFTESCPDSLLVGYDFSHGMLRKARRKNVAGRVVFVEGDAAELPFCDNIFDIVTCSYSLYELKGQALDMALLEMKRVLHTDGLVLLMEHEVPNSFFIRLLFYTRLFIIGSNNAREFLDLGLRRLKMIFPRVDLSHSPSGKSRLLACQK